MALGGGGGGNDRMRRRGGGSGAGGLDRFKRPDIPCRLRVSGALMEACTAHECVVLRNGRFGAQSVPCSKERGAKHARREKPGWVVSDIRICAGVSSPSGPSLWTRKTTNNTRSVSLQLSLQNAPSIQRPHVNWSSGTTWAFPAFLRHEIQPPITRYFPIVY